MKPLIVMLDPIGSNSMKSSNPHSGFHAIDVWPCMDTSAQHPGRNQGGGVIVNLKTKEQK